MIRAKPSSVSLLITAVILPSTPRTYCIPLHPLKTDASAVSHGLFGRHLAPVLPFSLSICKNGQLHISRIPAGIVGLASLARAGVEDHGDGTGRADREAMVYLYR